MTTDFSHIKEEIRMLGFDDAPFTFDDKEVLVVGAVTRKHHLDGVISTKVTVDGDDATERLTSLVLNSRHYEQIRVIMLKGITLGGFNIVDITELGEKTELPIIVVMRKKPDMESMKKALEQFDDAKKRWDRVKRAGNIFIFNYKRSKIYLQSYGVSKEAAINLVKLSLYRGVVPEPIRLAHIIARGVTLGESMGRA
ncbi:MAG: DUF99 family protein [Candidatus Hydrothermarchaeota archaeon]